MPDAPQVVIDQIAAETLQVPIVGTAPLLMHKFGEKAKRQMLDNMQGRKTPKESKNPQKEYEEAFYRLPDGQPCFPSLAFKQSTVGGARFYSQVTMTALKQYIFFHGEAGEDGRSYVRIEGEPTMQEDVVTVGRGTDLRYRPQFMPWSTELEVTFVSSMLTENSTLSLIEAGGMGVGVGEWRPEKNGESGCYRIDPDRDVQVYDS
jgi:hypothetical protein